MKQSEEVLQCRLGRYEHADQAFEERDPADEGDDNQQHSAGLDIVAENHRQLDDHRQQTDCEQRRLAVNESFHHLHRHLLVGDHVKRDENAVEPDQPAKKYCAWRNDGFHSQVSYLSSLIHWQKGISHSPR